MSEEPYARQFVHSCYMRRPQEDRDAVVIKEYIYPTKETKTPVPNIRIIENPKRQFAITKPQFRTHNEKREWENLDRVDWYTTYNKDMTENVYRALYGKLPYGHVRQKKLDNSPYIYGTKIGIETLIHHRYTEDLNKIDYKPVSPTVGMLDIETSVLSDDNGKIIIITTTHENKVYTAILREFLTYKNEDGEVVEGSLQTLRNMSENVLHDTIQTYGFEFYYHIADTPQELIFWIMKNIHENHTDFIGIWNIDFDIPKILNTLNQENIPLEDVFSHPDVPEAFRYAEYRPDNSTNAQHFTRKWHWLNTTGTAQFYDAMCLYSILRVHEGLKQSYSLDAILQAHGIGEKLKFKGDIPDVAYMSNIDWHRYMQEKKPYEYIIYNQYDAMSLQILEWSINDVNAVYLLVGDTHMRDFNKQSRMAGDVFHFECLKLGKVIGTIGEEMVGKYDHLIPKDGGAVLRPERTHELGMKALADMPHVITMLHPFTGDLDFSQMYPTAIICANLSRETKKSALIRVESFDQGHPQEISSKMGSPVENAQSIGSTYLGLPAYTEMWAMYKNRHGS